MNNTVLLLALFSSSFIFGQSLPIDFESDIVTTNFVDFDGGSASVILNPQSGGINESETVAQIVRDGGAIWSGSKIELSNNLDFESNNSISMKVYTTAPAGTTIKFKLESESGSTERDVSTSTSGEWETLTWDFTGTPDIYNNIVFMFDFGNIGDGSSNSTFLFDDIQQLFGGEQIDFPLDFEGSSINYTTTDFGGNVSSLVMDPEDVNNHIIQVIKTDEAAAWAGTTIGTMAGFASNLPLQLTDSKMTIRVWSPDANIPIRLKVEDSSDPTHTCETETKTTTAQQWETLVFDFNNQATGTESLSVGLSMGWTYNMASIFFNFGTEGTTAGEKIYYFDDVKFGDIVNSTGISVLSPTTIFPNPTSNYWNIKIGNQESYIVTVIDLQGRLLYKKNDANKIDATSFQTGVYLCKIETTAGSEIIKLVKN